SRRPHTMFSRDWSSDVCSSDHREHPFRGVREGGEAFAGDGRVEADGLRVRVRRWWDPSPALGAMQPAALAEGGRALEDALAAAGASGGGLAGHPGPAELAEACAAGDLAGAVEAAERIVGLGPGLTPSGDDILCGLLVSLRLVGDAVRHGRRAVWLADWLGAAVTADAGTRTTALAATLLHCAAAGGAGAEVAAVLRGVAGHEPPALPVRRLLAVGHTSGADPAQGVLAGCRAALALTTDAAAARRAPRASAARARRRRKGTAGEPRAKRKAGAVRRPAGPRGTLHEGLGRGTTGGLPRFGHAHAGEPGAVGAARGGRGDGRHGDRGQPRDGRGHGLRGPGGRGARRDRKSTRLN